MTMGTGPMAKTSDVMGYTVCGPSVGENQAAMSLMTGPKSATIPVHDSMAGYNGTTPTLQDNIEKIGRALGYAE